MTKIKKIKSEDYYFNLPDIEENFRDKINELVERFNNLSTESIHRCPVCGGSGMVPNGFYNTVSGVGSTSSISPEVCRSCSGSGYIINRSKH